GGLVGAVMLGLGRAMGETIAAALVIGAALGQITANPFAAGYSMPAVIANEWGEADDAHKAALVALAVTLFVITIAVNLIRTAIVGTLLVTGGATLIAVPLGILGAVYLHEYGTNNTFARLVRFMTTVMTGVPSIVMGLFVYLIWTMKFGYSAFGGALALACLM